MLPLDCAPVFSTRSATRGVRTTRARRGRRHGAEDQGGIVNNPARSAGGTPAIRPARHGVGHQWSTWPIHRVQDVTPVDEGRASPLVRTFGAPAPVIFNRIGCRLPSGWTPTQPQMYTRVRLSSPTELRRGSGDRRGGVVSVQPQPSYPFIQSESLCIFHVSKGNAWWRCGFCETLGREGGRDDGKSYRLPSLHRRPPSLQGNRNPAACSG